MYGIDEHNKAWADKVKREINKPNWFNMFDAAESYAAWISKGFLDFFEHCYTEDVIRELGRDPSKITALEIGYGGGRLLRPAAAIFNRVIGIDVHDCTADQLKLEDLKNIELTQDTLHLYDNSVSFIYSYLTFQYFIDIKQVTNYLAESSRILMPKGIGSICFGWLSEEAEGDYLVSDFKPGDKLSINTLLIKQSTMNRMVLDAKLSPMSSRRESKHPWEKAHKFGAQSRIVFRKD